MYIIPKQTIGWGNSHTTRLGESGIGTFKNKLLCIMYEYDEKRWLLFKAPFKQYTNSTIDSYKYFEMREK